MLLCWWCVVSRCDHVLSNVFSVCSFGDGATTKYYKHYPVLPSTTKYYEVLQSSKHYQALRSSTKYYDVLRSTKEYYEVMHSTTMYFDVLQNTVKCVVAVCCRGSNS